MTIAATIRAELLIGPMTAPELSAITGMRQRLASAHLCALVRKGDAKILGKFVADLQEVCIYGLTEIGRVRAVHETKSVHNVRVNTLARIANKQAGSNVFGLEKTNKTAQSNGSPVSRDAGRGDSNPSMLATLSAMGKMEKVQ